MSKQILTKVQVLIEGVVPDLDESVLEHELIQSFILERSLGY